jgi:RimJ/RimL family protein N-acetyltransferase
MTTLIENVKRFSGVKIIELDVMTVNKAALRLYENLGFKAAGQFPNAFILPSGESPFITGFNSYTQRLAYFFVLTCEKSLKYEA